MSTPITKRALKRALQVTTDAEVARFFGISQSAVSQWGEDAPIPELRQLQAERKRPDLFAEGHASHQARAAAEGSSAATPDADPAQPIGQAA